MIDAFLREKLSAHRSPYTIRSYRYTFRQFPNPLSASSDDLRQFLAQCPSPSTAALHYRHLKTLYSWAERHGIIDHSPIRNLSPPRATVPVIEPYTESEIQRMLSVANLRNKLMIVLLSTTGIRRAEAARLRREDVGPDSILVRGKGRRDRYVPLADELRTFLALWPLGGSILGLTHDGVYQAIRAVGRRAGVHAYPHRFRDTFAVRYLERGGSIDNLQTLLGHTNITMTLRYVQYGRQQRALDEARRITVMAAG